MSQKICSALLNIVISVLFIVFFNIALSPVNLYIGLNPFSVGIIAILGFPGVIPVAAAAILF